ncbi:helix-turn-helix domain-containing protein [Bacillus sp. Marseille-P3661]|uniref:helix-turn-helix domain-containing protein n=1 Tax=Bacillus sp. Marseille-P3661 TaxID=1936234 RepID=UPI000C85CABE|nr:helix-turn-helix transcriptional regulator [Bacillus sp. Marseille-P3661]
MYGKRLKELRIEHRYTLEDVGKIIGIKKSSYASYETKYRQPPLDKLKSLAKLYGVSVDYILGLTDERNIEVSIQNRLKEECSKRGLHWDGIEMPEEVIHLIEKVLEEVTKVHQKNQNACK